MINNNSGQVKPFAFIFLFFILAVSVFAVNYKLTHPKEAKVVYKEVQVPIVTEKVQLIEKQPTIINNYQETQKTTDSIDKLKFKVTCSRKNIHCEFDESEENLFKRHKKYQDCLRETECLS